MAAILLTHPAKAAERVCDDGAMILRDGQPFPIPSIIDALNAYTSTEALREALQAAEQFIVNGVESGFIRMPDPPDSALDTLPKIRAALSGSPAPTTPPMETEMTEAQIKHMVDRFLSWKLPTAFNPDGGISFERIAGVSGPHPFVREPVGTNLLSADQATEMVRHMLEGLPSGSPAPSTEGLRTALMLAEKADRIHSKCQECEDGAQSAEACEHCFPSADDARVARRNVLKTLGVKMRDVDRTALAGVTSPTTRSFNEHMVEDLIVAAYKRGFIWANHNPVDGEFLDKAARDYADYTMNAPPDGVTAPSEVDAK